MTDEVDLQSLAVDRSAPPQGMRGKRNLVTRYVIPGVLITGFLSLIGWCARELIFEPRPVTVMPVIASDAAVHTEGSPLFQAAGWIEPRPTPVRVTALAPGVVEKLLVVEDQAVRAGEPVAELIKDDAQLVYDRALADLELRRAEADEARARLAAAILRFEQPVHLEAPLGEAQAALATVDTALKNLPFELRRAEADHAAKKQDYESKVAASGVVAAVKIDIAKSDADAAAATVEELRDRAESLRKQQTALTQRRDALKTQLKLLADETKARDAAAAMLKAAQARTNHASIAVAEAKLQLDRMTITAPVAGRVFHLVAHPGSRIGSGMTQMIGHDGSTIVTLYQPDSLQIRVDVRFDDIPNVSPGQRVEIRNPVAAEPMIGTVLFVSSEADIQKNTLEVKVAVPDSEVVLRPEMLMDCTFLASASPDSPEQNAVTNLYLPNQLIQRDENGSFVWVADQSDGVARLTQVELSDRTSNGLVQVTKGLSITSRVITGGLAGIQDGDRIRVTGEDEPIEGSRKQETN